MNKPGSQPTMLMRLPDDVSAGVKDGDAVDIDVVNGEIVVRSVDWHLGVSMRRCELPSYVELHSATDEDPTTLITTSQCMGRIRHVLTPKSSDSWSTDEWRPWAPIFGVDDVDGIRQAIEVLKLYPDGKVRYDDFELVTEESSAVREEALGPVEPIGPLRPVEPVTPIAEPVRPTEDAPMAPIAPSAPLPLPSHHDVEQELLAKLSSAPNVLRRRALQRQLDEHRKRAE